MASTTALTCAQKIEQAMLFKEEGNKFVKDGDYKKACKTYRRVFAYVNGLISKDNAEMAKFTTDLVTPMEDEKIKELKATTYSNLALCYLRLKEYPRALEAAEKAIDIDNKNIKAHHRAGIALTEMKLWERAKEQLMAALKLEPENVAIKNEILTWKNSYAKWCDEQKQKEKNAFGGKFL
jgi:tetratricopeptide (TPR) repeat protein